jgi:Concanavalin A-like lectin/glucanases superfamily
VSGQRRAQYVSLPLGPGIYSNTTGRGAKVRLNYVNWDRWYDASWVRWHKLLAEKQGGWQYQPLIIPNATPALIPGSPVLLLHFDGTDGQTSTFDSSPYDWPVALNTGIGTALSTTDPKFGSASLAKPDTTFTNCCLIPPTDSFAFQGPLDILSLSAWTIECFFMVDVNTASNVIVFAYGSDGNDNGDVITLVASMAGDGLTGTYAFSYFKALGGGGPLFSTATVPIVLGTWYHLAIVNIVGASGVTLYINGIAVGNVPTGMGPDSLQPSSYIYGTLMQVDVGAFSRSAGIVPANIDEFRVTPLALYTTNFTPPTAENTLGLPNTLGTATPPNAVVAPTYLGVARDLHDWSSIDGQYWIAIGTHVKLYIVNQATLYDITPDRKTSNVANALTTVNASNVVTVVDPGHQANTGDFIDVTGASPVGGLTIAGDYQISVIDPSTYTIVVASNATSGATGGGNFSIAYEISAGLPSNGELLGYGTGPYGIGTYGTPRPAGTGVFARMRTWSLDNYGQDLIASESDGEIYWWQKDSGPNSPAAIIPLAPQGCQRVLVDAQQEVIIALGCTDSTSAYDAMLVRWCSFGNITDWVPSAVNTAGEIPLTAGSRIVTGLKTKGQNLIFTDTTLYRMVFVGSPDIYDFYPSGGVTIVGPNAAVDVDGVGYLMGFDNFYNYSGTLNLQACEVWETVFDPNFPTSLDRTQSEGVTCYTYEPKTEITWLYPSIGGVQTITFTAGIAQGATSATLAAEWTGTTGLYNLQFSDQEAQVVQLTNGETTATWGLPLTGPVSATATTIGNDRYVTYNWEDGTWYYGAWNRTCAMGRAPAMGGYPYGVNAGYLYQHEIGTDAVEASGTNAIGWHMRSMDITVGGAKSEYTMGGSDQRFAFGGSDAHLLLRSMLPDWQYMTGEMNLTISTKDRPQDAEYVVNGPVAFNESTSQIDIDAHGSQLVIALDNFTAEGGAPSLGSSFRMGIFQGLAIPYAKR